jgi:hypothetical protein
MYYFLMKTYLFGFQYFEILKLSSAKSVLLWFYFMQKPLLPFWNLFFNPETQNATMADNWEVILSSGS